MFDSRVKQRKKTKQKFALFKEEVALSCLSHVKNKNKKRGEGSPVVGRAV